MIVKVQFGDANLPSMIHKREWEHSLKASPDRIRQLKKKIFRFGKTFPFETFLNVALGP